MRQALRGAVRPDRPGAGGIVAALSLTGLTSGMILLVNTGSGVAQARGLGPVGRGNLALAMLWPSLIVGLGDLGLREAIAYRTARDAGTHSHVLSTTLVIGAGQAILLAVIGREILPIVLRGRPPAVLSEATYYLWLVPLYPLVLYPLAFLQGKLRMGAFNALTLWNNASSTAILLVLWVSGHMTVHAALTASLISYAAVVPVAAIVLLVRRDWAFRPDLKLVRPLLWFGARQQLGGAATLAIQLRVDMLVLSLVVSPALLGTYAVAASAGSVAAVLPMAAAFVLYPAFARRDASLLPGPLARVIASGGLLTLVAGPLLVVGLAIAVPVVFGSTFSGAGQLALLLSVAYLVRGWNVLLAALIRGLGKPLTASVGQAIELVILGVLLLTMARRFGATGAAVAVLLGAGTSFACLLAAAFVVGNVSLELIVDSAVSELRWWRKAATALRPIFIPKAKKGSTG